MKKRIAHFFFADLIRSIGIIGVVIIHSANYILYSGLYSHGLTWWFANIIRSTARVSVPLFIMLSGFLVWGVVKKQPYSVAWKKNRTAFARSFAVLVRCDIILAGFFLE